MTDFYCEDDDDVKPIQILTIIAIANMKDRSGVNPDDHFGMADSVKACVADPKAALQEILKQEAGIEWDAITPLWGFIVDENVKRCAVDKAIAVWGVDNRRRGDAVRLIEHARAVPGSVAVGSLRAAEALIVSPAIEKPIVIQEVLPEPEL